MILEYATIRPLLLRADDSAVVQACHARDDAHQKLDAAMREATTQRRRAALDALAADPTLGHDTVIAAELADTAAADTLAKARTALTRADLALEAALASPALLHVIAVARADHQRTDPNLDTIPRELDCLYRQLRLPPLAYGPAHVTLHGSELVPWWPLALGGYSAVAHLQHPGERHRWNEWAWSQLARPRRKGYRIDGDGRLQFRDSWTLPEQHPSLRAVTDAMARQPNVHVNYLYGTAPGTVEAGDLVMVGTGPNGERGVTVHDLRVKTRATLTR